MVIKYLNDIHNISNYLSITKGGLKDKYIHLRSDEFFFALDFDNHAVRDVILSLIWTEMVKKTAFLDIDKFIETYKDSTKYNL